jgi:heterotetrameric sarcosine oxidase gamma subunit
MGTDSKLPPETDTLVIGAGIVGCSAAYHLTQHVHGDITVVDQGAIPQTGGSTTHAPAGLLQTTPVKMMSELAQETREIYTDCGAYEENGGIEIATTEERWTYLQHRMDQARAWGLDEAELLTPGEVKQHVPLVDTETLLGGYHVPTDGRIQTIELLDTLRHRAVDGGATFHEHTKVIDISVTGGNVNSVTTSNGRIDVENVLIAGNIWAPIIGEMVGVEIPLVPCEHQYAITEPIDELEGWSHDVEQPWLRHQDEAMYFRQHGDGYGIGNYNHEPLVVKPTDIAEYDDAIEDEPTYDYVPERGSKQGSFKQPSTRPFTEEHFGDAWAEAQRVLPPLESVAIDRGINGMFAFTPDHMPILGSPEQLDGFWVAAGVWLTQGGAAGRVIADLVATGTTDLNIDGAHISRFQSHSGSPSFVFDRGYESYAEVYDIHHPRGSFATQRNLRQSPFQASQNDLGAEFYDLDGWERARWYEVNQDLLDRYEIPSRSGWEAQKWSPIEGAEHLAVRDRAGLLDLTSMTIIEISGQDSRDFLQRMVASDIDVDVGDVVHTLMLDQSGGIVGKPTVVRRGPNDFLITTASGGAGTKQCSRLRQYAPSDGSVNIQNQTSAYSGVAVWGPDAEELLAPLVATDLSVSAFPQGTAQETYLGSVPVMAVRDSRIGESGWELHTPMEYGQKLWSSLIAAAEEVDAIVMGDGALNTLSLESGYRTYGIDIHAEYTPVEAGLGSVVDSDIEFVGRDALAEAREHGVDRELTCMRLEDPNAVVLGGTPVFDGDTRIGFLTKAEYGYTVGHCVAYGYLPVEYSDAETGLEIQYENERYAATVLDKPLLDGE